MRDILVSAIVFGAIPFMLRRPFVALLMWVWLGIMNPHRFTYGFAFNLPFAQVVAICLFLSLIFHRDQLVRFPRNPAAIALVALALWICVSPWFSLHASEELAKWSTPFKIMLMTIVALLVVSTKEQINALIWILALSVGFFGVKGGLFTILSAGSYRVYGPPGSFIEENNALGLATIMTVPLFRYLQLQATNLWVRRACIAAMVLCVFSALGSQSRGAFLAIAAMSAFLFVKSRNKVVVALVGTVLAVIALSFMPEQWWERMHTIRSYDQDASAMGRINAWWMAWNLAVDRFPIGGGFAIYKSDIFLRYAPDPNDIHAAHSIYFQILGEHGFVGLALFMAVFLFAWANARYVARHAQADPELLWALDLAKMCQVSLAGFAVGGAFLSLTYFDLPYYLVVVLVVLRGIIEMKSSRPPGPAQFNP